MNGRIVFDTALVYRGGRFFGGSTLARLGRRDIFVAHGLYTGLSVRLVRRVA
jgi:hypothetical protein